MLKLGPTKNNLGNKFILIITYELIKNQNQGKRKRKEVMPMPLEILIQYKNVVTKHL